jgi:peptide chain release factor 1
VTTPGWLNVAQPLKATRIIGGDMKKELHLTKKDFRVDWFSGSGAGGQHRNKHQNCCRITHIETGLCAQGTESRDRVTNQRNAFNRLVSRIIAHHEQLEENKPEISNEVIRIYHAERNEVIDKASGLRMEFKDVVLDGDLSEMIESRHKTVVTG